MARTKDDEDGPERTCLVTRRKSDPDRMIRFVLGPDDAVVPDIRRKLPGRGVWLLAHRATVQEAVKKQIFSRGFKTKVAAPADLAALTDELLSRDALQSLAMANKAGIAVTGFAKVEAAIAGGNVGGLLHAVEAGEDGIRKIEAAVTRRGESQIRPTVMKLFSVDQLDLALGRTNAIHAALAAGPVCDAFLSRCRRLMLYRSDALPDAEVS